MDAKATVGIVESLLALLHDPQEAVSHIAVAFDNPIRSFRNDLFEPYKSDEGVPPELRAQFDAAEQAVSSIGVTVWSMREYEADDGLASGARRFRDQVEQVRILTPDKDLGQCLCGDRVVQVDRRQKKVTSEGGVSRRARLRTDQQTQFRIRRTTADSRRPVRCEARPRFNCPALPAEVGQKSDLRIRAVPFGTRFGSDGSLKILHQDEDLWPDNNRN